MDPGNNNIKKKTNDFFYRNSCKFALLKRRFSFIRDKSLPKPTPFPPRHNPQKGRFSLFVIGHSKTPNPVPQLTYFTKNSKKSKKKS